jgi:hypothetical protein
LSANSGQNSITLYSDSQLLSFAGKEYLGLSTSASSICHGVLLIIISIETSETPISDGVEGAITSTFGKDFETQGIRMATISVEKPDKDAFGILGNNNIDVQIM